MLKCFTACFFQGLDGLISGSKGNVYFDLYFVDTNNKIGNVN